MEIKLNCWEYFNCGRYPGGAKVSEYGVCLATIETRLNGMNGGKNGGRVCWAVAGTLCEGKVHGTLAAQIGDCMKCEFHQLIILEEGAARVSINEVYSRLK